MAKPKLGDLVEVDWIDAVGIINDDYEKAKIHKCKSIGILMRDTEKEVVLCSSTYGDGSGDYTAIPKGWQEKVTLTERRKP